MTREPEKMTQLAELPRDLLTVREVAPKEEKLLTVAEVATYLRVDTTTVRRWIKAGSLEAITLPHRGKRQAYRLKQSTLDTMLGRRPA